MTDTYHKIYLHGLLGEKFTKDPIELYASDLPDIIRGLTCNLGKAFRNEIYSGSWHIVKGSQDKDKDEPNADAVGTSESQILQQIDEEEIHIYPRIEGAITLAIIGSALSAIGATGAAAGVSSLIVTLGGAGSLGVGLVNIALTVAASAALSAVTQAINSPEMDYEKAEVDRNPSFLFNGVVNVVEQGGAVPLVYGKHLAGSTVISSEMLSNELGTIDNELDPEDENFYLPTSPKWSGVGATVSNDSFGSLSITKTASSGTIGYARLDLALDDDTEYKVILKVKAVFDKTVGSAHFYDDITIDAYDGSTLLGISNINPSKFDLESSITINPTFEFKTLSNQINPFIRIYAAQSASSGAVRTVQLIKIEKIHV